LELEPDGVLLPDPDPMLPEPLLLPDPMLPELLLPEELFELLWCFLCFVLVVPD
jgi:hypothetical protein